MGSNQDRARVASPYSSLFKLLAFSTLACPGLALHHLDRPPIHLANRQNSDKPLRVTNSCPEVIYPGILTQFGTAPLTSGFRLDPGDSLLQTVSADWRGRIWGRTNCTFDSDGSIPSSGQGGAACGSGDCGQFVQCQGAGNPPATLAEFTLSSNTSQAYYDISLVDGYNLPMGIVSLPGSSDDSSSNSTADLPPNLTNPICIGSVSSLVPVGGTNPDEFLGSNSTYPIPLERSLSPRAVLKWCPWPLQLNPPQKPGDGVYPYPDDNIDRPVFNPCFSACAKWNDPQYCCTGGFDSPQKCKPSYYSTQAKKVCPDAYSYAFDDLTSTFIIPEGGGFEVVFCPTGRSSNILNVFGDQMREVARTGIVTQAVDQLTRNKTYIEERSTAAMAGPSFTLLWLTGVCLVLYGRITS